MSIEWSVRLTGVAPAVREVADQSRSVLTQLLGGIDAALIVYPDVRQFLDASGPPVPAQRPFLDGPVGGKHPGFVVAAAEDRDVAVWVSFVRVEGPEDDHEAGDWLVVNAGMNRSRPAYALGIAVAVAAGLLVRSEIIDEAQLLGIDRQVTPAEVLARLAVRTKKKSLSEAADALIVKTKLKGSSPP